MGVMRLASGFHVGCVSGTGDQNKTGVEKMCSFREEIHCFLPWLHIGLSLATVVSKPLKWNTLLSRREEGTMAVISHPMRAVELCFSVTTKNILRKQSAWRSICTFSSSRPTQALSRAPFLKSTSPWFSSAPFFQEILVIPGTGRSWGGEAVRS